MKFLEGAPPINEICYKSFIRWSRRDIKFVPSTGIQTLSSIRADFHCLARRRADGGRARALVVDVPVSRRVLGWRSSRFEYDRGCRVSIVVFGENDDASLV
ncbi:hypothetical protein EVAR_68840_1 [Eumeta japonica]|uniref:Uncharacterized protein n=1 Tax=Eumeta variegata TaxID=151549 RepID=A0A4C2A8Z1_EUMVA|nr:hypothetical protein EVAR_68840_1 [Eumeta japonica]